MSDIRWKVGAVVLVILLVFAAGVGVATCSRHPDPVVVLPVVDVDAIVGERIIAEGLDAEVQLERARIAVEEQRHAEELAALDQGQRADYERQRAQGADALALWFKARTRALLVDAGGT